MSLSYQDFRWSNDPNSGSAVDIDRRWWALKGEDVAHSITRTLNFLSQQQSARQAQYSKSARLYGNVGLFSVAGISFQALAGTRYGISEKVTYNVAQSVVDTVTAKMAKNRPKPFFLTSGGDWKSQRKAKKLNQFVEGMFWENKAYDIGTQVFRDACVWGDGLIHVFPKNGRVCLERVLAGEVFIDEYEGLYGRPRQLHWVKSVDRSVLAEGFKSKKSIIENINAATIENYGTYYPHLGDLVTARESWHLPSGKDAKDGKHVITVDGDVLFEEPWNHDFFPFARLSWCERPIGYWSQGLVEQIQGIQFEINKLLMIVQRSMHLGGTFKVLIKHGSKIVSPEHINNDVGAIIEYSGDEPKYIIPPLVPPEIYEHLLTLVQRAYEQAGISMLNATSEKPAGLNSGKALREYNDINTDRFNTVGRAYENLYLDLARLGIACAKDIAEESRGRNYEQQVPGKRFLSTVNWKDIDLEEDAFTMQCFPISSLPNDPAGRLQTVQEYAQAGYLSPREARRLLDFPDLDQIESLANAQEEWLLEVIEKICDEGEYEPPEPFDNLQLALEIAQQQYAYGKIHKLEPERLELLREYMVQVTMLQQAAAPLPQLPPVGAQPGAAPQAPAQSDLIPNAPNAPLQNAA